MSRKTLRRVQGGVAFLLVLIVLWGCSGIRRTPTEQGAPTSDKPYVEVLIGQVNYDKASPRLAVGNKLKFKGAVSLAGSKGKTVAMHLSALYEGDQPAVQARDLTKDFMADRAAAEKKYKLTEFGTNEIIVEGVVSRLEPGNFTVVLAGHEE
jgi:hypothetical protein